MSDLVEWLRAQLDEDELDAADYHYEPADRYMGGDCSCDYPRRFRADVEAKRRILDAYSEARAKGSAPIVGEAGAGSWTLIQLGLWTAVQLLALPYADRPGYRNEWRPDAQ